MGLLLEFAVLALAVLTLAALGCDPDEFECVKNGSETEEVICISKYDQCDEFVHCNDGWDEADCTVTEFCDVEKLSCKLNDESKCYDATTQVCTSAILGADSKCTDKEDVQHCRCDPNQKLSKPFRCPIDGMCYDDDSTWCDNCPDALSCNEEVTPDDCGDDPDYFSCMAQTGDTVCYPLSALCDAYKHCHDMVDLPYSAGLTESPCRAATVTLTTSEEPTDYYIGGTVSLEYTITGFPKPTYTLYHYGKPMTLPLSYEGSTVTAAYVDDGDKQYKLTIVFTNLGIVNYGSYKLVVSNVANSTVNDDPALSYYHRIVADEVTLNFKDGLPTASMLTPGNASKSLDKDVSVVAVSTKEFELSCKATGYPEPDITFTRNGEGVYPQWNGNYSLSTTGFDNLTHEKTDTLIFVGNYTAGNYSCIAISLLDLEGVESQYKAEVKVLTTPTITRMTGTDGWFYALSEAQITLECEAWGIPHPWLKLYKDGNMIADIDTQYADDGITSSISHTVTNSDKTDYTCDAESQLSTGTSYARSNVNITVTTFPVVAPTIAMADTALEYQENAAITIPITVTTGIDVNNGQHNVTVSILTNDRTELDAEHWTVEDQYTSETLTKVLTMTAASASVGNIGDFIVVADNSFYDPEEKTFSINVIVNLTFVKELAANTEVQVDNSYTFEVQVLGNPAPSGVRWYKNGTELVTVYHDACTVVDSTTEDYVVTYQCNIEKAAVKYSGNYKVIVTQPAIGAAEPISLESETEFIVSEDPCQPTNPCQNNGNCTDLGQNMEYSCSCNQGFSGKDCDVNEWCDKIQPCENNGTCTELNHPDNYQCDCLFGYINENCSFVVDFCNTTGDEACGVDDNRGLCRHTRVEPHGFDCYCRHDYGGLHCGLMQLCTPNPCENDGLCVVEGQGDDRLGRCECEEDNGWIGDTCQDKKPGHCWDDQCDNTADCADDGGACLCHYPYYMEHCDEELHGVVNTLHIAKYGYLVAEVDAYLEDDVTQQLVLPVKLEEDTGVLLLLSEITGDATNIGDNILIRLDSGRLKANVSCVTKNEDDTSIDDASILLLDDIPINVPITLTLTLYYNRIGITAETYETGEFVSTGFKLPYSCNGFTGLRLSDQIGAFNTSEAGGIEMSLWDEVCVGQQQLDPTRDYNSGRSVGNAGLCSIDLCMNGGHCLNDTISEWCSCNGTGYTGDRCEQLETCDLECLNGGMCMGGFCHCQLGYHGVLCEEIQGVSDNYVWMRGESSYLAYETSEAITSVKINWRSLTDNIVVATRAEILTIGEISNNIKLVGIDDALYLIVIRGSKIAVHEGIGQIKPSTDNMSYLELTIVDGDIQIRLYDPDSENDSSADASNTTVVTISSDQLPCPDGLPAYKTAELHGLEEVSAEVLVTINSVVAKPTGGMNIYIGADGDLCASACGDGDCTQSDNMIGCSNCPNGTNPVTCGLQTCDSVTCNPGTCSQTGECICDFNHQGADCSQELVITAETYPKTVSSQYSWLKYQAENIQGVYVDVSFYVWLEGDSQTGQLMYTGNEEQHLCITLDGPTLTASVRCSDAVKTTISLDGVQYGEWMAVGLEWYATSLTFSTSDDNVVQLQFGICSFDLDGTLYLGGRPDGASPSLLATFSDVALMLPPQTVPVDGAGLTTSDIHVCDGPVGPCSRRGTTNCTQGAGTSFTCVCKPEYEGTLCGDAIVYDPCDDVICSANAVCREGDCVCPYPYLQTDTCMTTITDMLGFCFVDMGYLTLDVGEVDNDFDIMFRVNIPDDLPDGEYELARLEFDGSYGDLVINKTTTNEATEVKLKSYRLDFELSTTQTLNAIRVKLSGLGAYVVINNEVYFNDEAPVLSVSALTFGSYFGSGYPSCIFDVMLNGHALDTVVEGFGVKVCNDLVLEDGDQDIYGDGALWAKVGIL